MMPKIKYWMTADELNKGIVRTNRFYNYAINKLLECQENLSYEEAPFDDLHRDAIIKELVKNKYLICGDTHQSLAIPMFNDGYILVSMRVWKEIMEEAYFLMSPFKDPKQKVPNFYMASVCNIEEVIPCTQ